MNTQDNKQMEAEREAAWAASEGCAAKGDWPNFLAGWLAAKAAAPQPPVAVGVVAVTDEQIIELHDSMFPPVTFEREKTMGNVVKFARALLAATQSEAAPAGFMRCIFEGEPPYGTDWYEFLNKPPYCNLRISAINSSTPSEAAPAGQSDARYKAERDRLLDFIKNAPVSSGVCCCGDAMDKHPDPMSCGHNPIDMWDHSVLCLVEEIANADAAQPTKE